uniref:Craniofacial development protein 1 n=1 Tax=Anopheles dirus TaxID=7168 RepID=A0A182N863_9DIPT
MGYKQLYGCCFTKVMNQEDYPSDSDASDDDFRPDKDEADSGSELETDDEVAEESCEPAAKKASGSNGNTKRKRKPTEGSRKKSKGPETLSKAHENAHHSSDDEKDEELDEEEEKRRTDALWADFLGGSSNSTSTGSSKADTKSPSSGRNSKPNVEVKNMPTKEKSTVVSKPAEKEKPTVAQLFEFAGEQIILTEDRGTKTISTGEDEKRAPISVVSKAAAPKGFLPRGSGSSGGGLGAVLNQIGQKNKLSTLEKTKLDWTSFKRQEGIEEELQTHNKGKDGFLERRDFLERTDLRQFEIEKSFRQTKRSNR